MDGRLLLAFAAGAILATLAPGIPGPGWILLLLIVALCLLAWPRCRLPAMLLVGSGWFLLHAAWLLDRQWPEALAGESITLTGSVAGLPELREQGVRFVFRPDRHPELRLPSRVMVNWYRPGEHVQPGQRWALTLRMEPPHGRLNPGGFDFHRHLLASRIGAVASVSGSPERIEASGIGGLFDRQRQYLAEVLQAETTRLDAAALKRALAMADRGGMTPQLSAMLRETGTAHLLAISGLHVGMVAAIAGLLASWLLAPLVWLHARLDRRRMAIMAALLAAVAYALLAGLTLPTQRALIMLAVGGGAFLLRRAIRPGHALLLALVAILLIDPMAPLATGFWLSFAAVAVLIWAFAWRPGGSEGAGQWLIGLIRAQLAIAVGMLALNVGLFQQVAPAAVLANLVAIPLVGFWILPSLLLSAGLILLDLPSAWVIASTENGLVALLAALEFLHRFEWGHRPVFGGGLLAMVVAMIGALWLLAPVGWPARWLGAFLLLPLLWPRTMAMDEDELKMHLLDVGNGLAVLIETRGEAVLFDTGPGDGEGGDALGRILPDLSDRPGAASLQRVIVSHGHRGHAGGLGSVQDRVPKDRLVGSGVAGRPCHSGEGWQTGAWQFRFLHPSPGLPDLGANSSCVLHVSGPGGSLLLTGGIDAAVEQRLVLENPALTVDVLVLASGGHQRATSAALLELTRPGLALASVARFDRSGRPHPDVIERLGDIRLVTTGQCGALSVTLHPDRPPQVESSVGRQPRFWRSHRLCP